MDVLAAKEAAYLVNMFSLHLAKASQTEKRLLAKTQAGKNRRAMLSVRYLPFSTPPATSRPAKSKRHWTSDFPNFNALRIST
jgi:hypothetical protein